jgi:phosphohistidine phosphatase
VWLVRRLFLLRHAKSSWDDPQLTDHDRPLALRGRRASEVMADYLGRERIAPELVICSSAARTRETLQRVIGGRDDQIEARVERGLYMASADELLDRVRAVPGEVESVMLIGHNPGIQTLALSLAGGGEKIARVRKKFPTGALATLEFNGAWDELRPGGAELVSFVRPKELDASR